ncbi:MAG: biotin/lipoyl-binding protein [Candidatus Hydrogenedentes bacterium]|nr:biotin/lipoyl-binding protein [Candidatus Hydrogenedentota bacterium]
MWRTRLLSVLVGLGILFFGVLAMAALFYLKRSPAEASVEALEKPMVVEARKVFPVSVPVVLSGYGEVAAVNEVAIAPEVSGRIVEIHPNLIEGGLVAEGDLLFQIEPQKCDAIRADAQAQVRVQEESRARLEAEWHNEEANLEALRRKAELAKKNFERAQELSTEGVGSQADVDSAEENYVTTKNQVEAAVRNVALYPARIRESAAHVEAAQASLQLAQLDYGKTAVRAPFNARIKQCELQKHQLVTAGLTALTLADDSVLEIAVPLNSQEARNFLAFEEGVPGGEAWFNAVKEVRCEIRWTEDTSNHLWQGTLNRVQSYDPESRTITVAVRPTGNAIAGVTAPFPLVEGMFCEVRIPGRTLENVYQVDSAIVNFDNTLFVSKDNRLATRSVVVARQSGEFAFITDGLEPGDVVITTRLVDPLENSLLEVSRLDEGAES